MTRRGKSYGPPIIWRSHTEHTTITGKNHDGENYGPWNRGSPIKNNRADEGQQLPDQGPRVGRRSLKAKTRSLCLRISKLQHQHFVGRLASVDYWFAFALMDRQPPVRSTSVHRNRFCICTPANTFSLRWKHGPPVSASAPRQFVGPWLHQNSWNPPNPVLIPRTQFKVH